MALKEIYIEIFCFYGSPSQKRFPKPGLNKIMRNSEISLKLLFDAFTRLVKQSES